MTNLDNVNIVFFNKSNTSKASRQLNAVGESVSQLKVRGAVLNAFIIRQSYFLEDVPHKPNKDFF